MSVLFDSYENELKQALKKAKNVMNNFHMSGETEKSNSIRIVKEKIREAEVNYNKMESDYAVKDQANKALLKKKVEQAFKDMDETRKRFTNLERDYIDAQNRNNLLKEANADKNGGNKKNANEMLYNQNKNLTDANKIAQSTLEITNATNVNLLEQRDLMNRVRADNAEIAQDLNRVDSLSRLMANRELFNKAILWIVIFLLAVINVLVLLMKIKRLFW